jgi:hypothetical protein
VTASTIRVSADDRKRIPVGRLGVHPADEFEASRQADGTIVLTPLASIPRRELLLWENDELRRSLLTGLAESAAGLAHSNPALNETLDDLGDDD